MALFYTKLQGLQTRGLFEEMSRKREKYLVRYQEKCVSYSVFVTAKDTRKMLVPHVQRQTRKPVG